MLTRWGAGAEWLTVLPATHQTQKTNSGVHALLFHRKVTDPPLVILHPLSFFHFLQASPATSLREMMPTTQSTWLPGGTAPRSSCWGKGTVAFHLRLLPPWFDCLCPPLGSRSTACLFNQLGSFHGFKAQACLSSHDSRARRYLKLLCGPTEVGLAQRGWDTDLVKGQLPPGYSVLFFSLLPGRNKAEAFQHVLWYRWHVESGSCEDSTQLVIWMLKSGKGCDHLLSLSVF